MEPQNAMSRIHALVYMRKFSFEIRQVPESTGLEFVVPKGDDYVLQQMWK